jgi:hypothetical protein
MQALTELYAKGPSSVAPGRTMSERGGSLRPILQFTAILGLAQVKLWKLVIVKLVPCHMITSLYIEV